MRSGVIARLMSMMAPHNRQHRRIRLHAMVALVAMMHDSIMTIPIVMRDNVALKMCLKVAVNMHDTEAIRRQALLIIRSVASYPGGVYHSAIEEVGIIEPMQHIGRDFAAEDDDV